MREWFLSTELVGIDTMPGSLAGISQRAKRENWNSRKASGGGRSLEYHISNFDTSVQHQLFDKIYGPHSLKECLIAKQQGEDVEPFETITESENTTKSKYIELDFYDVEVSAGHCSLVIKEDQSNSPIFSRQFIENEIGVNTQNIFLMPVKGDSMAPTLKNKAIIMVNRIEEFSGDGIYVFRFDSQLMVKRLQFTKTGLNVVSDNTTYEPWQLTRDKLSTENFKIIGEVVWSGQRI
ncbi:MAG: phage repressor protein C with HTH and peptisase S24 domain [Psychromonas sp.]|jgi:phage repressor protein C with HTH and peptisase S24 domain|uniref:helix-turn-helix domain-containing protein n=1 Tax=Psychromonas sp. TaxID=1884585 RepID=UPI0039E65D86